ncbi:MAG TPA: fasciclin domain-containing protein [Flavisolibacter sp.]|nr:fasciclin domain-containing protein [Flavisolibacter sp.]
MKRIVGLFALVLLLAGCKKKFDEYYERPDTLEPPIYQQLEAKGNFKNLLAAIDKAGYKPILSAAGYWTFFAPHDSAFQVYFKEIGVTGIDQLSSDACRKIVTYSLVYNAFEKDRIDDFQSNTGWVPDQAFKRRTAAYTGVYDGRDTSGTLLKIISSNRNNNGTTFFVDADNNNKYIPILATGYMSGKGLSAADYNYFYANTPYTGFNVVDAVVTETNIRAENGIIHVVNKVITSLPSLDEYLGSNPAYSEFRKLFDRFLVQYALNAGATQRFQALNPGMGPVFTKVFAAALAYSPNNENFLKLTDNDGQANTYSMFAPTNDALKAYINNVLLENYPSKRIEDLPINIIYDFVNAHLWQTAVWPSKFSSTFNFLGEEARFNAAANVVDKKILSNGIFYGTNKVQEANVFSSVFGKAYLNPKYSMMTALLSQELKFTISNVRQQYTLFLVSNQALNAAGYYVDVTASNNVNEQWKYEPPGGGTPIYGSSALVRLLRVLNLHVVPRNIPNLVTTSAAETHGGEFITFGNNRVQGSGNVDLNLPAIVDSVKTARNGTVYYINRPLEYSNFAIGTYLKRLGTPTTSEFNYFWRYVTSTDLYNTATDEFTSGASTGSFYTFLVPNKAAIENAIRDNMLPGTVSGTTVTPKFTGYTSAEIEKVQKFIKYHILKKSYAVDGQGGGSPESLFQLVSGEFGTVNVRNETGTSMVLTDMANRQASVVVGNNSSNQLGNRITIHLINNYLKYVE